EARAGIVILAPRERPVSASSGGRALGAASRGSGTSRPSAPFLEIGVVPPELVGWRRPRRRWPVPRSRVANPSSVAGARRPRGPAAIGRLADAPVATAVAVGIIVLGVATSLLLVRGSPPERL